MGRFRRSGCAVGVAAAVTIVRFFPEPSLAGGDSRGVAVREFRFKGRGIARVEMVGSVPGGITKDGIEVQVAGIMVDGDELVFSFGIASVEKPTGVVVEDCTSATAIRLVEQFPAEGVELGGDGRWLWFGQGGDRVMDPETLPWVFSDNESSFVFRFFVQLEGGKRVEIYQPALFGAGFKKSIRDRMGGDGTVGGVKKTP